ncbi:MAG TPA: Rrf2 family transcriptional regulator [Firmicutes bacterium]|nr:Rrf2 family transcriptional regulator [Bacillota bacterium]HWR55278.1 Rrf2 family transcriptional regulator [Negativicutes bacterium]
MQLTQATDYAFRAVQHLAATGPEAVIQAQTIARQEGIPLRFLLRIMRSLTQAGIVKSYRGVDGGYALAKPPAQISLRDVIEAVEGPVRISRCLIQPDYCSRNYTSVCPIHQVLGDLQVMVSEKLAGVSFADLAKGEKRH